MGLPSREFACPGCAEEIPATSGMCPFCQTALAGGKAEGAMDLLCRHCGALAPLDASVCPSCNRPMAVAGGPWIIVSVAVFFMMWFGLGILAAIAVPSFQRARIRANERACYANQKTIAGAIEMYQLDYNTSITELSPRTLQLLKDSGYIQGIPTDPGFGPGSSGNYQLQDGEIRCQRHGSITGSRPRRSIRRMR